MGPQLTIGVPEVHARTQQILLVAFALIAFSLFVLDLLVPPWRLDLPLSALEVPANSTEVEAIRVTSGAAAGRSVLLVTLDTVRPDRLGYHGHETIDTPTLDRLAREGVIFSGALATASSTLPTHASILTGLYPHRHGAPANGAFRLRDDVATLAAHLRDAGYETAAFVSAFVLDAQFGLSRGFRHYDDETSKGDGPEFGYPERRADRTTDLAIDWLRESGARPFFVWVHLFDPHADYTPPPEYDRYGIAYDGELAFADAQLGRLVEAALGAAEDDLLIAVTADHGEAFGEQGEDTHSILVQETTLRIPLVLHAPGAIPGGVHVPTRVSQVDVMPTILSLLGKPIPTGLDGADLTEAPDPGRTILAETVEAQVSFGWAPLSALYQGHWKLVEGPNPELYDLENDPLAREDLSDRRPEEVARLQAALRALREDALAQAQRHDALSGDDVRRLQALGYAGPARAGALSSQPGPDPVSWMPLLAHVDRLASLYGQEIHPATRLSALREGIWLPARGEEVIELIEEIAEEHPDFAPAQSYLRDLYQRQGRTDEAITAAEKFQALVRAEPSESDR